jgi:hypothetical protein
MRTDSTRSATCENVLVTCFHESGNRFEQDTAGIYLEKYEASQFMHVGPDEFGRRMLVLIAGGRLHDYDVIDDHTSIFWEATELGDTDVAVSAAANILARDFVEDDGTGDALTHYDDNDVVDDDVLNHNAAEAVMALAYSRRPSDDTITDDDNDDDSKDDCLAEISIVGDDDVIPDNHVLGSIPAGVGTSKYDTLLGDDDDEDDGNDDGLAALNVINIDEFITKLVMPLVGGIDKEMSMLSENTDATNCYDIDKMDESLNMVRDINKLVTLGHRPVMLRSNINQLFPGTI